MSKRTAPKDSKASGFKTLKAFFTSGPKKSPPSSTATTPEPDNSGSSTPETPIPGPSRLLEPLAPLATIKDDDLSSISSISPLSEQALHSPSYIDLGIYNFSSLDMDRDIKFALLDNPNKPPLQVWPYELVTKQGKQEKRTLGPQHLERYQFLTYSMIQEGLYCRFCFCFADLEEIKKAGRSAEIQLVNKPFKKFARLSNYLDPHQKTAYHKKSLEKAQDFLDSVKNPIRNIEVKLDRAVAKEMEKNRKFLAPIVSTIVFTARLGLPFRRPPKTDSGQLIESSSDRPCFCPNFSNHHLTSRFCKAF